MILLVNRTIVLSMLIWWFSGCFWRNNICNDWFIL